MTSLGCGRQALRRTISTGQFTCRNNACASHGEPDPASYRVVQGNDWFRLFYLPIVPVGRGEEVVECESCGMILTATAADAQPLAATVPFVVDGGPRLEITARPEPTSSVDSIRLVVGAPTCSEAPPSIPGLRQPGATGPVIGEATPPQTPPQTTPQPPQRPAGTSCGLCGTGRAATDGICDGCGAVFTDRSTRSCVRHRIALPDDANCPVCGPDGVQELEPTVARSSFFG